MCRASEEGGWGKHRLSPYLSYPIQDCLYIQTDKVNRHQVRHRVKMKLVFSIFKYKYEKTKKPFSDYGIFGPHAPTQNKVITHPIFNKYGVTIVPSAGCQVPP